MTVNLSTLSVLIGLAYAAPMAYGLAKPAQFSGAARSFSRSLPWGYALMLLSTAWFLYNLSQESVADFEKIKHFLYLGFAAIGIGSAIFVRDFLSVRGLAVVLLLLAKLMVDAGRPALPYTSAVLLFQAWAYVFVVAGIWLTISPWRLRDFLDWLTAHPGRQKAFCLGNLVLGVLVAVLGITCY